MGRGRKNKHRNKGKCQKGLETMIMGIDHGYYAIKTRHFSFPAGVTAYTHEPYTLKNTLQIGGKYYVCGTGRQPILRDKTVNDNYYILTLAEDEPVFVANAQLEELDYRELYRAYSPKGRKSAAEPRIMFKLLVYGYMCGIYSMRKLEQACRKNLDFIWLLQGERVPDHTSFARFRSGKARQAVEDLFYQFVKRLAAEQEIEYEEVFIDGTKIESMANRYTFVWRKSVDKQLAKVKAKAKELFYGYGGEGNLTTGKLRSLARSLIPEGGEMVHGTGRRKPFWQRQYEEIGQLLERWKKYETQLFEMGCRRNSLSKTDKDATFMRMKEDHMGNGQLKPAYNVQLAVNSEYITGVAAFPNCTDSGTLMPFLNHIQRMQGRSYWDIVADAGYESVGNYLYLQAHGQNGYITGAYKLQQTGVDESGRQIWEASRIRDENGNEISAAESGTQSFTIRPNAHSEDGDASQAASQFMNSSVYEDTAKASNAAIEHNAAVARDYEDATKAFNSMTDDDRIASMRQDTSSENEPEHINYSSEGYREAMASYMKSHGLETDIFDRGGQIESQELTADGTVSGVKPTNYEIRKIRKYKQQIWRMENMQYLQQEDCFVCAAHRKLRLHRTCSKKEGGIVTTCSYYRCEGCGGCPLREQCTKSRDPNFCKEIKVCEEFAQCRAQAHRQLATDRGALLRMNRSIQVEGAFGVLKSNRQLKRFLTRGRTNISLELFLLCLAYNLEKYWAKLQHDRLKTHLFPLKKE